MFGISTLKEMQKLFIFSQQCAQFGHRFDYYSNLSKKVTCQNGMSQIMIVIIMMEY